MPTKNFTLNKLLEVFHNTQSTKDKMLEADPNCGRSNPLEHTKDARFIL